MKTQPLLISILPLLAQLFIRVPSAVAELNAFDCSKSSAVPNREARVILDRVQKQYAGIESMRGRFRQESFVAALDEGESSSGTMVFSKPGKMRWSYKVPNQQEVVIKDGELWLYQLDKGQVMIDDINAVLLSALPVSFLMGLGNVTKDFDLVSACRSSGGVVLKLVPHDKASKMGESEGLEGFDLLIDEGKNLPQGAKITSVGGNVTGIVFENLQLNTPVRASEEFVLEYPKGVDILDRRLKGR
jgi:outer membrane lipoprotein carrier protein